MALHKETLDIQNNKLPIIHPGEVADRILDALQGFNPFKILRHTFWILMGIIILLFIFILFISNPLQIWGVPNLPAQSGAPPC
jgi:hypothetical protein